MTEMKKLIEFLNSEAIPYELVNDVEGNKDNQIFYPCVEDPICDVICHKYSYGYSEGLLEIMGLVDEDEVGDTVEGYLTAAEVFNRIKKDYELNKK